MQWLKKILLRGVAIAIPLAIVAFLLQKIVQQIEKIIGPIAHYFGISSIWGELTLSIFTLIALLALLLLLGLLMRLAVVHALQVELETLLFQFFPWLNHIKMFAKDKLALEHLTTNWQPALLCFQQCYYVGFVIEEGDPYISVFLIKGTSLHEGEMVTLPATEIEWHPVQMTDIKKVVKHYGAGMQKLMASKTAANKGNK